MYLENYSDKYFPGSCLFNSNMLKGFQHFVNYTEIVLGDIILGGLLSYLIVSSINTTNKKSYL